MSLDQFEEIVKSRRAVRQFESKPIDSKLLDRILDQARWAPSGYNLQPTHFFVVTDEELKKKLHPACFYQKQVLEAPVVVVFTGDRKVYSNNFEKSLKLDLEAGAVNEKYLDVLRKYVGMAFEQGPFGLGWLGKFLLGPIMALYKVMPSIPAVQKRYWLTKQVCLASMNFMLAAKAAGLDTVPMEGFDESRVKKILNIPKSHIVPIVIPIGHSDSSALKKTRLPLSDMTHYNQW